ncbi:uncharacterized protein LOC118516628 [Anopheles stephensi]|uniref:uncharacterized protein LOC118516628 n=1 Tax=Anopheles stephensi TaxID=30069 RepID=UPI0016587778|nr:uncharacterized protein LOC118516628 [Anopheles stephensi]
MKTNQFNIVKHNHYNVKKKVTSSLLFYPKSEKGNTAFGMSPVAIVVQMIPWEVRTREGTLFHPPEELRIIRHRQVATRALSDAHVNSELATGPDTWTRASAPRQPLPANQPGQLNAKAGHLKHIPADVS